MAIKGKGKSKSRGVAKPPRREPVPVPVPFIARPWIRIVTAFLVGIAVSWFAIWVTNGLRTSREAEEATAELEAQRQALQSWQAEVEAEVGAVGEFQDPSPPAIAASVRTAIRDLEGDGDTSVTADALRTLAGDLDAAADALEGFPLADQIRDKGFGPEADTIITARLEFVEAMRAYRGAAMLILLATEADDGDVAAALTERASDALASADGLLADAHRKYRLSLGNAGILTTPDIGLQP